MKIYDAKTIVPGVVIFLALATSPLWYNIARGATTTPPQVTINTAQAAQCIEPTQWMIEHHPELLIQWRNNVVRNDIQTYTASDGKQYQESLATCAQCHPDTEDFCNQCHNYIGVSLDCWNCHNLPAEGGTSATK